MDEQKYLKLKSFLKYAITVITTVVITLLVVMLAGNETSYLKTLIKTYYVDDVDENVLNQGAMAGMLSALGDKHTYYISPELGYNEFQDEITGEYGGIGIMVTTDPNDNLVTIVNVFSDTPAAESGVKVNDKIVEVNGEDMRNVAMDVVVSKTRGAVGESLELGLLRGEETVKVKMTRQKISSVTVNSKIVGDNIGYISISTFDKDTQEELKKAITGLGNINGLIIDLRNNPGGIMQTTVEALDMFIDQGTIITAKYKGNKTDEIKATGNKIFDMPLVVLVNENSASASEIFSACIKDNKRGKIVGVNTYGKGSIQRSFELPGNAGASITIGKFYSPNGDAINKVGVKPDIEVKLNEEYKSKSLSLLTLEQDNQLQAAINALK